MYTYSPLLTDLYQLTMAYGYWKLQMHEQEAAFHVLYRSNPFKGNYALCCGLQTVVDFLKNWHFTSDDLSYLASLKDNRNNTLFPAEFLEYLGKLKFSCHVDAVPEGTIVFPQVPLLRIEGSILQCQLLETPLLNILNFQTLVATKASRVYRAAKGAEIIEFGMRRAQGPDGAISASRAAYIGGCSSTSNTLAGKLFDIPVRGTHAHSWVTAFPDELSAFQAYASVMPHNCVLLVDTYNTIEGVANAIEIGKKLRTEGAQLLGIRLDSGDLAQLSIKARKLLDDSGFTNTQILASNSLSEEVITSLLHQGARIDAYGVGTHLATAYNQPALDGVYKLSALKDKEGVWRYKLKLSETTDKISNPGRHQVRRFFFNDQYMMDVVYDLTLDISDTPEAVLLDETQAIKKLDDVDAFVDLLEPVFRRGEYIQKPKTIHELRASAVEAIDEFYDKHGDNVYPIALEKELHEIKQKLIAKVKRKQV